MRSAKSRAVVLSLAVMSGAGVAAAPASAAQSRTCDGVVQRVLQRSAQPTVLQAVNKISVRGMTCKKTTSIIGGMMLQVGASSPTQNTLPSNLWFADDRDYWAKQHWKVERVAGDPASPKGARWHITKGKISLRFTRWM